MHLSSNITDQISALVAERLGLSMHIQTRDALDDMFNTLVTGSISDYLEALRKSSVTDPIWQALIDALTIGETYFLRDRAHFHMLREHILPDLLKKRAGTRTLSIWSVGCATGEEPYSLAITLAEILPEYRDWTLNIVGTDINERALRVARHGIYRKWAFRHTDHDFQARYFDATADGLMIQPEIQQIVRFQQANIFTESMPSTYDLILCRNVLLYFGSEAAGRAEHILHAALAEGGWLMLGHAEAIRHTRERWVTNLFPGAPIYHKSSAYADTTRKTLAQQTYQRKTLTQEVVAIDPEKPLYAAAIQALYAKAVKALHAEDYDAAEQHVRELVAAASEHAPGRVLLACILANRHEMTDAHAQLDAALYINPLLADAHYLRAVLLTEEGKPDDSYSALIAALYAQRNHPLASFMLGNLHAQRGELIRASRYWENTRVAIKSLLPDSPVADISPLTAGQLTRLVDAQLGA